ncbi:MAG TPA: pantetheine-phosphate adenylyltransferase [Armatimonadota bacterium]|jgi:pantetheine-phosphate adenylyltransferase
MPIAVCPGSFDPVTDGHLDIIQRASGIFDQVIVAVAVNPSKNSLFSLEERVEMLREVCSRLHNVTVDSLEGLLIDYVRARGARCIVKGLRAISDFELEFQQALMNSRLAPDVETMFLMTRPDHSFLSSTMIKQVVSFGGDVAGMVPPLVQNRLREKFGTQR